jgi:hypothetical protein
VLFNGIIPREVNLTPIRAAEDTSDVFKQVETATHGCCAYVHSINGISSLSRFGTPSPSLCDSQQVSSTHATPRASVLTGLNVSEPGTILLLDLSKTLQQQSAKVVSFSRPNVGFLIQKMKGKQHVLIGCADIRVLPERKTQCSQPRVRYINTRYYTFYTIVLD